MEHINIPGPNDQSVFRLAYASRPVKEMSRTSVVSLTDAAAASNLRRRVSGVLLSGDGVFLQWLEGHAKDVRRLMSSISQDARHTDVTVLSAGWIPKRRFARWPMHLVERPLSQMVTAGTAGSPPYDMGRATVAFDQAAESYRETAFDVPTRSNRAVDLADRLIHSEPDVLPDLPCKTWTDLRQRAQLVDDVCKTFSQRWCQDVWSSAQVAIGLAKLNRLWQRAGRVPDPVAARRSISIVVPPRSSEIIGAIVKADLFRASGTSVHVVLEADAEATFAAVSRISPTTVIVTGSRAGLAGELERSSSFAERMHGCFPNIPIHVGGRSSGALCECPERIGFGKDEAGNMPERNVEWLALQAMANLASRES